MNWTFFILVSVFWILVSTGMFITTLNIPTEETTVPCYDNHNNIIQGVSCDSDYISQWEKNIMLITGGIFFLIGECAFVYMLRDD